MKRNWDDERDASDAPVWFDASEAAAWASGWNAAIEAATAALDAAWRAEHPKLVRLLTEPTVFDNGGK